MITETTSIEDSFICLILDNLHEKLDACDLSHIFYYLLDL